MAIDATSTTLKTDEDAVDVEVGATGQQGSIAERQVAVEKSTSQSPATFHAPSAQATRPETSTGISGIETNQAAQGSPAQGLEGAIPAHETKETQTTEDTARQAQHLAGPGNPSHQLLRANLGGVVQSWDAVDLDPDEFDTFVAIPCETTTNTEKQAEQPPRKANSAIRPFILRRSTEAQKRAALSQTPENNGFADRYDYLKKYPEDPPEEAMGPNARVWRVYLDEAEQFDIDMVDGFKDTVDVMLVFAGLFSAVVTTFVVQASTALQLDYNQVIASVLIEQLQIQRAIASGLPTPAPLSTTLGLDSTTTTGLDRWANGLWFVSLSFSLATALFAVLIKQWIQSYVSPVSGDPQTRVRVRQYRFMGLEKWHVPLIVGLLPTLLHLSLLLFFLGLVVFLFALDQAIAGVIVFTTTVVYLIYFVTNLAPLFNTQCPYKTPLSIYAFLLLHPYIPRIRALSRSIIHLVQTTSLPITIAIQHTSRAREALQERMRRLRRKARQLRRSFITRLKKVYEQYSRPIKVIIRRASRAQEALQVARMRTLGRKARRFKRTLATYLKKVYERSSRQLRRSLSESTHSTNNSTPQPKQGTKIFGSMKACELEDITAQGDVTDAQSLCWVVTWSSNPSVKAVVLEAVCDLPLGFKSKHILRNGGVGSVACASLEACTTLDLFWRHVRPGLAMENLHFKSALAHFQLGWCFFPTLDGRHMKAGTARHVPCIYDPKHPEACSHGNIADAQLGPYVSLLLQPSWELVSPQHMSDLLPPNSPKIVFLLSLQRAALYIRTDTSSRSHDDMIDWPSCQKLFACVQPEPPPTDLFGLWQTTLVSVYLASLVPNVAPILEHPGLLRKLLFNHIELGSSDLSRDLAINLSKQSFMEFFAHTLNHPTLSTDFSSSPVGGPFIRYLKNYLKQNTIWVSYPAKNVIGPHHTLLVALLDLSEKHGTSMSAKLRKIIYHLGYNLMERSGPQLSDPELDLVSLYGRLLRAALIPPLLSEPCKLTESQILCILDVLHNSPPRSRSILLGIFKEYDGINTLEKLIQSAGQWQHNWSNRLMIGSSLEFYLEQVSPTEETSLPCRETDITPHGGQSDANSQVYLNYILQHLAQIIRTCVACHHGKIPHPETDSYPDTLRILRCIAKAQHEASPQWNHALAELESQGFALPVSGSGHDYVEQNVQEVVSILRSDLEAARSPGAQDSSQPSHPLPPQSSIYISEAAVSTPSLTLEATVGEESLHPTTRAESIVSRSTRRFRTAVWGVIAARRVAAGAIIPLHTRTPIEHVQEHGPRHSPDGASSTSRRDEEEGLGADISSIMPT